MTKCPNCEKDLIKLKSWTYGNFEVQAYSCDHCKTEFREYTKAGKHSFTLKRQGKGYVKLYG